MKQAILFAGFGTPCNMDLQHHQRVQDTSLLHSAVKYMLLNLFWNLWPSNYYCFVCLQMSRQEIQLQQKKGCNIRTRNKTASCSCKNEIIYLVVNNLVVESDMVSLSCTETCKLAFSRRFANFCRELLNLRLIFLDPFRGLTELVVDYFQRLLEDWRPR